MELGAWVGWVEKWMGGWVGVWVSGWVGAGEWVRVGGWLNCIASDYQQYPIIASDDQS